MLKTFSWLRWLLAAGLVALPLGLGGCFQSPTNPFVNAFSDNGCSGNCGSGATPTPTPGVGSSPTPTLGPVGSGSISGTISNSGGGTVYVYATETTAYYMYQTSRTGDGPYTISNMANGTYEVEAIVTSPYNGAVYPSTVSVSGGAVTNINISF